MLNKCHFYSLRRCNRAEALPSALPLLADSSLFSYPIYHLHRTFEILIVSRDENKFDGGEKHDIAIYWHKIDRTERATERCPSPCRTLPMAFLLASGRENHYLLSDNK